MRSAFHNKSSQGIDSIIDQQALCGSVQINSFRRVISDIRAYCLIQVFVRQCKAMGKTKPLTCCLSNTDSFLVFQFYRDLLHYKKWCTRVHKPEKKLPPGRSTCSTRYRLLKSRDWKRFTFAKCNWFHWNMSIGNSSINSQQVGARVSGRIFLISVCRQTGLDNSVSSQLLFSLL